MGGKPELLNGHATHFLTAPSTLTVAAVFMARQPTLAKQLPPAENVEASADVLSGTLRPPEQEVACFFATPTRG